ncbi:lactonase family protein [Flagellimonas sp. 389]|uniref:lactonase family protein n=1 Tax=Flagellimonas sp. 389 TaxID=2835862 RepID=UPI001BD35CC1|nr:lactonase family protein [Flagellimonas sp. 389]MBS9461124.1 lactonase family protein [Flagellimonas sp. 389]
MKKQLVLFLLAIVALSCKEKEAPMKAYNLFVGTYTGGESKGIYRFTFNSNSGELEQKTLTAVLPNPSFLTISNDKNNLYAVQETADFDSLGGGITAFRLKEGLLELQNSMGTGGAHPCHVTLSGDGQLAVSNYTGGNLSIFELEDDGALKSNPHLIDHKVLDTVKAAHVHKAHFSKDGLFASDLGLDALKRYSKQDGNWKPAHQSSLDLPDGAGPRHFVFDTTRNYLYVINELNSSVSVFKRDNEGSFNKIQIESTLDLAYEGKNSCADIHLSPDGRFLYGSNRGENTIVIFEVDSKTGKLGLVGRESVHGDWPRNFAIDPSGSFLLVANQRSNNIAVFQRDNEKGILTYLNDTSIPSPVCLEFL